jgi:hypothetical protein
MDDMHLHPMTANIALLEVLGISQQEFQWIMDRPNDESPDVTSDWKYPRHRFRIAEGIVIHYARPEDPHACVRVAPRDISCSGATVLHRGTLRGGTAVRLEFPSEAGLVIPACGRVVRCFGLFKDVYEVGIHFDAPLDLAAILGPACQKGQQSWLAGVVQV